MLSPKKLEAASLLAEGLTRREIAKRLHKSERTIAEWKQQPAVLAEVRRLRQLRGREFEHYGLAQQSQRLQDLQILYDKIWQVIRERAEARGMDKVAGGSTGLLVREPWKTQPLEIAVANPKEGEPATIYHTRTFYRAKADLALVQELREIQKQIAIELGQWTERRDGSMKLTGVMKLEFPAEAIALAKALTPEQLAVYRAELEKQEAAPASS